MKGFSRQFFLGSILECPVQLKQIEYGMAIFTCFPASVSLATTERIQKRFFLIVSCKRFQSLHDFELITCVYMVGTCMTKVDCQPIGHVMWSFAWTSGCHIKPSMGTLHE